jgi:hypothetical protein
MPFEYVTSTVSVIVNDGIAVHVLNHGGSTERARIQFFENTGAGAVQVADSGDIEFIATGAGGLLLLYKNQASIGSELV